MLDFVIMRADTKETVGWRVPCAICREEFELGVVYIWMTHGPHEVCERCLEHLCEWAASAGIAAPWRDAYRIYQDARKHYTEPITTMAAMESIASDEELRDEELRVNELAYLTPWPNPVPR
jgi:hypothetical protein